MKQLPELETVFQNLQVEQFTSHITVNDIEQAKVRIKNRVFSNTDLFIVLCALNLLNAAIKRKEYKNLLNYRDIKGHTTRILTYLINFNPKEIDAVFCINAEERCAYLEVFSVQFSFHQIPINDAVNRFIASERNKIVPWQGKRLQRIAGELFRLALEIEEK